MARYWMRHCKVKVNLAGLKGENQQWCVSLRSGEQLPFEAIIKTMLAGGSFLEFIWDIFFKELPNECQVAEGFACLETLGWGMAEAQLLVSVCLSAAAVSVYLCCTSVSLSVSPILALHLQTVYPNVPRLKNPSHLQQESQFKCLCIELTSLQVLFQFHVHTATPGLLLLPSVYIFPFCQGQWLLLRDWSVLEPRKLSSAYKLSIKDSFYRE